MEKILEIISKLEATTKRTDKNQILMDAFMNGHYDFFRGAIYAYDNMKTFGIKKVPLVEDDGTVINDLTFSDFIQLCDKLIKRELTGHAARDAINDAALSCEANTWNNFYRRILLKDLKCGVDVSTFNTILNKLATEGGRDYLIPTFECQSGYSSEKYPKKMVGEKLVDTKMDGVRCLAVINKEEKNVTLYTRSGHVIKNYDHVEDALLSHFEPILDASVVLDGELLAKTFKGIMEQLQSHSDVDRSDTRLHVFDFIPYADFIKGSYNVPQIKRHQMLMALQSAFDATDNVIQLAPKILIDLDTPDGQARLVEYYNTAILNGFEGAMVKDPNAPYLCKKSHNWLKMKPSIEVSLKVVGFIMGDENKAFSDVIGSLVCEGEDEGRFYKIQVSSGITEKERIRWTEHPEEILDFIVEVTAMQYDYVEDGNYYSLRHPRLKGIRGLEKGQKI